VEPFLLANAPSMQRLRPQVDVCADSEVYVRLTPGARIGAMPYRHKDRGGRAEKKLPLEEVVRITEKAIAWARSRSARRHDGSGHGPARGARHSCPCCRRISIIVCAIFLDFIYLSCII